MLSPNIHIYIIIYYIYLVIYHYYLSYVLMPLAPTSLPPTTTETHLKILYLMGEQQLNLPSAMHRLFLDLTFLFFGFGGQLSLLVILTLWLPVA